MSLILNTLVGKTLTTLGASAFSVLIYLGSVSKSANSSVVTFNNSRGGGGHKLHTIEGKKDNVEIPASPAKNQQNTVALPKLTSAAQEDLLHSSLESTSAVSPKVLKFTEVRLPEQLKNEKLKDREAPKLVEDILQLLKGELWATKSFHNLWIYKIEAVLPRTSDLVQDREFVSTEEVNSYTSGDFGVQSDSVNAKKVSISLNSEALLKIQQTGEKARERLNSILSMRSEIAAQFFSGADKLEFSFHSSPGANVLRFSKSIEGKHYYLDIYFSGDTGENQLSIARVNYKDKTWWQSDYYQANGSWSKWRNHIGGNREMTQKMGQTWTELDEEFAGMFTKLDSKPEITWKFFSVISQCLRSSECAQLFRKSIVLSQRNTGIDRSLSWVEDHYRNIHPFSELFYKVSNQEYSLNS
ncbi:hypothetical protein [Candidatus Mycoplasma haematominutum]|uniref:Uncharacterized protein n=1 Tax=Candidatus Mycoplasma haematominutum 'Birmingham 1' TaxID=1116213 RepID=G8C2T2_9MOLU|nr:hypothetical protein [Candidatus Mycoplasma haematominutum]CCE66630.1 hypothetical protein MHM_01120 [Candidatus Mycoplasma haematominutum 'Birmingham 1']